MGADIGDQDKDLKKKKWKQRWDIITELQRIWMRTKKTEQRSGIWRQN